jgi:acetolactate synthase-1/2/3 large subunit
MGFGLPAAMGAAVACGRRTVCVDGDGGFQMNIQELATVARLGLPVKYFVINNGGYASIRTSQRGYFDRLVGADATSGLTLPDLGKVAAAYGVAFDRIADPSEIRGRVRDALDAPGPVVCEVVVAPDEERVPRASSYQRADGGMASRPLEDLFPFLPRDEFLANMIVPPLDESRGPETPA